MEKLTRFFDRLHRSAASLSWPMRLSAAVLLALTVAAGLWLAVAGGDSAMVPAFDAPAGRSELSAVRERLDRMGIAHRVRSGRLLVNARYVPSVRKVLAELRSSGSDAMSALRKAAGEEDIWQSRAAAERRWQVAKMDLLSRMISDLPQVRSASVVIDGQASRKFGAPRSRTAAIVKVVLASRTRMTRRLTGAIADIVAGSVAGTRRQDVRIVDQAGRSYRAVEYGFATAVTAAERRMQDEEYYADRIRAALEFAGPVAVTVRVASPATDGAPAPCIGADVSVPRGHIAAGGAGGKDIERELSAIRRRVMRAVGITDPATVTIEWHCDSAQPVRAAAAAVPNSRWSTVASALALGAAVCVLAAAAGLAWWRLYYRRRDSAPRPHVEAAKADRDETFAFLGDLAGSDLLDMLRPEHPQTMAIVLAQVGPPKAAAVLAALEPQRQVDVVRRIANMDRRDSEMAREISAAMAEKLARAASGKCAADGVSVAAEILNHAGCDAERVVLEGLSGQEPGLAESIRERIFGFDDIVSVPADTLASALEAVAADDIAVALRAAGPDVRDRILSALAADVARRVRLEMEQIGPVRLSDVEAAQRRLAACVQAVGTLSYVSDKAEHDGRVPA